MSPLLFNLALDPLLHMLEERVESICLTALAYTDDLVLLSHDWSGMAKNLAILGAFCRLSGLGVNPKKCHGFLLGGPGKSVSPNRCKSWTLNGVEIPMLRAGGSVKYLGVQVSPIRGILKPPLVASLSDMLVNISGAPLKPS